MNRALEASLALVRDRPVGGNAHPSMLQHRFISASALVKRTAKQLIEDILADKPQDAEHAHWGEDGNAAAATNLQLVKCQEPSLIIDIPGKAWKLKGHPDGLDLRDEEGFSGPWTKDSTRTIYATVYENKAPIYEPGLDQQELYYRQGLLYLAMLHRMHTEGVRTLYPASWLAKDDVRNRPWALPSNLEVGQVVVCIQPKVAAKREQAFPVDAETCTKHLERSLAKAAVVVEGVEAKDPGVGEHKWDNEKGAGLGEFDLRGKVPEVTAEEVIRITEARHEASLRVKEAQAEVDALTESLERYLKANGIEEAKVGPFRVVLQRQKGGLRHFIVGDSVSLRVYGGPKPKVA
jgi:hypothetical protein